MKQTFRDLLKAISPNLDSLLDLSEQEVLAALPGRVSEKDRNMLIERFGLRGEPS